MESLCQEPEAPTCSGSTDVLPQLGLTASVLLAFLCSLHGRSPAPWGGGLGWKRTFPASSWGLGLFSLVLSLCWPSKWLLQGWGVEQDRAGLLWGCWVLCGAGEVRGKLPCPSSIPATFGMVWEVAHGSAHSRWNQNLCVGWAWPEEGFGSCLLAGEGVLGAAVLLGRIPIRNLLCCPMPGQKH